MIKREMKNVIELRLKDSWGGVEKDNIKAVEIPFGKNEKKYTARILKEDETYCYYVPAYVLENYRPEGFIMKVNIDNQTLFTFQELDCSLSQRGDVRIILNNIIDDIPTLVYEKGEIKSILLKNETRINNCTEKDICDILLKDREERIENMNAVVLVINRDENIEGIELKKIIIDGIENKIYEAKNKLDTQEEISIPERLELLKSKKPELTYVSIHSKYVNTKMKELVIWNKRGNDINGLYTDKESKLRYDLKTNDFVN